MSGREHAVSHGEGFPVHPPPLISRELLAPTATGKQPGKKSLAVPGVNGAEATGKNVYFSEM